MIVKNASFALLQAIISALVLFLSYSLIIDELGIEQFGIWAIIVPIVSIIRIAELGLSSSTLKHVSSYLGVKNHLDARLAIDTSILFVFLATAFVGLLFFLPSISLIQYSVGNQTNISQNSRLVLMVYVSVWLGAGAGVSKLALEGCQRYDFSALSMVVSNLLFIFSVYVLVPTFHLYGLATALIIQYASLFLLSRYLLSYIMSGNTLFKYQFSLKVLKVLLAYGLQMQVIAIIKMFLEPLTKILMGRFGDVATVGYFELASKFVIYVRSLLVAMNQVLVPRISFDEAKGLKNTAELYFKNLRVIVFISVFYFSLVLCMVPVVQKIWLEERNFSFEIISIIAVIAFFFNTLSIPAYMTNLGTGKLKYNIISHLIMGLVNGLLGIVLGIYFGGIGVVVSWALALFAGTIPIVWPVHRDNSLSLGALCNKQDMIGLLSGFIAVCVTWWIALQVLPNANIVTLFIVIFAVCAIILLPAIAYNSTFHSVVRILAGVISARSAR